MKNNLILIAAAALAQVCAYVTISSKSSSSSSFTGSDGVTVSHNKDRSSFNHNGFEHSEGSEEHNINNNGSNSGDISVYKARNGRNYYQDAGKWNYATHSHRMAELKRVRSRAAIA